MPRDPRNYITVHNGFPEHPKVEPLSDAAFRLLIGAWCYCDRNNTDGALKTAVWAKRGTAKARRELIEAGMVEETSVGVQMHDYAEHQRTAAEKVETSSKRAAAGRAGGLAKAGKHLANAVASASTVAKQTSSKNVAELELEKEELEVSSSQGLRKRGSRITDDWMPSAGVRTSLAAEFSNVDQRRELPKFIDYWASKAGKDGVKLDWDRTWRNWIRSAAERTPNGRPAGPKRDALGFVIE